MCTHSIVVQSACIDYWVTWQLPGHIHYTPIQVCMGVHLPGARLRSCKLQYSIQFDTTPRMGQTELSCRREIPRFTNVYACAEWNNPSQRFWTSHRLYFTRISKACTTPEANLQYLNIQISSFVTSNRVGKIFGTVISLLDRSIRASGFISVKGRDRHSSKEGDPRGCWNGVQLPNTAEQNL